MFVHSDGGGGETEDIRARPVHDNLAINVNHSLLAAPVLKNAPDLAWMTSYMGGDVVNRAQGVAGLHIANQIGHAVANFHRDNPEWAGEFSRHFADITRDPQMERAGGTNVAGDLMGWARDAKHDVLAANNDIHSISHATQRVVSHWAQGFAQYFGYETPQGSPEFNPLNSPASAELNSAIFGVQQHLEQTVFNPNWYPQEFRSLKREEGQLQQSGSRSTAGSVGGIPTSAATVQSDVGAAMTGSKIMLQWAGSQFDTLQHYYRAVEIAYRKYGPVGVINLLTPGIVAALVGASAGPEGSIGLGEAAAASGEEVASDGLLAGLPADAQAQVEAGLTKTAEQKAFEEAQAQAASPANKAKAVVSGATRPLRWAGRGTSHVLDALNAPASLGFQLAPTVMTAMPGIDPQYKAIWNASKNASGNLTTIGRGLSEAVGLGKNSALSGAVDGIVSLGEAPFMAGRAAAVEADATKGGRTLFAANADAVQNAFVTSRRYNSALKQIVKIVADNPTDREKAVGDIAALFPRFSKGVFTDTQAVNDILDAATSPAELNARLGAIADTLDTAQAIKLPTQGLYGKLKALKISDSKVPGYFNHVLAQAPMDFDANGRAVLTGTIKIGDPGSANMLGQLLRSNGWKSSDVSRLVGHLMTEADPKAWEIAFKNGLYARGEQILDKQFLKGSSIPESILTKLRNGEVLSDADHETLDRTFISSDNAQTYAKLQQAWHKNVNEMVGSSQSTESGIYGSDGNTALGPLADDKGAAAIWFSQRGYLTLPRYQDWDRAISDFLKGAKKDLGAGARFKNAAARTGLMTNDMINKWVNERFFKPLALLTPGWAFRVSLSEAALNTARIGPRNMLAGRVADRLVDNERAINARVAGMISGSDNSAERAAMSEAGLSDEAIHSLIGERGYTINKTLGDRIALITRGVMSQTDKAILEGLGKENFAKYAAYLIYRHDGWLPSATDSREMQMFQDFDQAGGSAKLSSGIGTQQEQLNPHSFKLISPEQAGGINGWQRQATAIAADPILGRPLAEAYMRLVESGKTGDELHSLAVGEAERILKSIPENELRTMSRATQIAREHGPFGLDPLASWAETAVSGLEGTVKVNAFINQPLLRDIANDELPGNLKDFHEAYVKELDRSQIPNMVAAPDVKYGQRGSAIERASAWGHQKVLGPIVNNLSRKPLFIAEFVNARSALEDSVSKGLVTADQADIIAETRAAERMTKYIHNPADKTHFEEMMRTVAPFYFAENQAWRRMGRLFAENPGAFGQYFRAMLGVQQWVSSTAQRNGISLVSVPGLALFGMPLTASLSSLQTMDPLATQQDAGAPESLASTVIKSMTPNFGPVVSFPVAVLAQTPLKNNGAFKWAQPKLQGEIGAQETFAQNVWSTVLPNSVLRNTFALAAGYTASNDSPPGALDNSYMQARLESIRELILERSETEWNSLKGYSPQERNLRFSVWQSTFIKQLHNGGDDSIQALQTEANRRAGVLWLAKMAAGLISPVSIGIGEAGNQFTQLMNSYVSNPKYHGDYGTAIDAFLKKYPYAQAATLYKTSTKYGYIPETKPISEYIANNPEAVQKYPYAMLAYGPSTTKDTRFYEPAASQLVADGLRQKDTPNEFLNSFFTSAGNQFFYNYIQKGYEDRKAANDPNAYQWYTNMQTSYGKDYNPAWWKSWNTDAGAATKSYAIQQLSEMVNDPAYNTPKYKAQTDAYRFILKDVYPLLEQRKNAIQNNYGTLPDGSTTNTEETKDWWAGVIALLLKEIPQAAPGIHAIFENQA